MSAPLHVMVVTSTTGEFAPLDSFQYVVQDRADVSRVMVKITAQLVAELER